MIRARLPIEFTSTDGKVVCRLVALAPLTLHSEEKLFLHYQFKLWVLRSSTAVDSSGLGSKLLGEIPG